MATRENGPHLGYGAKVVDSDSGRDDKMVVPKWRIS